MNNFSRFLLVIFSIKMTLANGELISVTDIRSRIVESSLQKQKNGNEVEKNNLGIKNGFNRYTPELSVFGGVKSKKSEFDVENDHFLGVRSQYKILDSGERNLNIQKNEKKFGLSTQNEDRLKLYHELEIIKILAKESSLKEKEELVKDYSNLFSNAHRSAEAKKRAGVLSDLDYRKIVNLKDQVDQKAKLIESELNIIKFEKIKKFNLENNDQTFSLKESLDQINDYIVKTNLTRQILDANQKKLELENELNKIEYLTLKNIIRPEVKAFVEKSITRKIDGQFLDGNETGNFTMGLEFEIPIVREYNENFSEVYKTRLAEKNLEIERLENTKNYELDSKIIDAKLTSNKLRIEASQKNIQEKQLFLLQKEKGIKNGLVSYVEYVEFNFELLTQKLEHIDLKETRNSLLTSLSND